MLLLLIALWTSFYWKDIEAGNITVDHTVCGETRGCYHDCVTSDCDFLIVWHYRPNLDTIEFTMTMSVTDMYNPQWFAIGFSEDTRMGQDSVVECVMDGYFRTFADVRQSYNSDYYNRALMFPKYDLRDMSGQMENGRLTCIFTRHVHVNHEQICDLDRPFYLQVARGFMYQGDKLRHSLFPDGPSVSPDKIDFRQHIDMHGQTSNVLVKVHGSLMIASWVLFASVAILLARFYKHQWPNGRACDRRIWYQVHKVFMVTVTVCVVTGFIIIFVHTQGYSEMRGSSSIQRAHPVIGIVVFALTILNAMMGFLRPQSGVASRALFKYIHTFTGTVLYVLAVLNTVLGVTLHQSAAPGAAMWVLVGFAAYQVVAGVIMEAHEFYLIKTGRMSDYEMKEMSIMRSDSVASSNVEPPGSKFKSVFLGVHVLVLLAFCIAALLLLLN